MRQETALSRASPAHPHGRWKSHAQMAFNATMKKDIQHPSFHTFPLSPLRIYTSSPLPTPRLPPTHPLFHLDSFPLSIIHVCTTSPLSPLHIFHSPISTFPHLPSPLSTPPPLLSLRISTPPPLLSTPHAKRPRIPVRRIHAPRQKRNAINRARDQFRKTNPASAEASPMPPASKSQHPKASTPQNHKTT